MSTKAAGLYEVMDYEVTLELHDIRGSFASVKKRQLVRYLQNHIIAYQDQVWGEGELLVDYQCAPGIPADVYQQDNKTIILISLGEEKSLGDVDEFNISWGTNNGFLHTRESWGTHIKHKTNNLNLRVIFPEFRPPSGVSIVESNAGRSIPLSSQSQMQLPDGRWQVTWRQQHPKLYETYILKWDW